MSWCAECSKSPTATSSHPARPSQAAPSGAPAFALLGQAAPRPFLCRNPLFRRLQSHGGAERCCLLLHPSHSQEPSATCPSLTSPAAGEPLHPLDTAV